VQRKEKGKKKYMGVKRWWRMTVCGDKLTAGGGGSWRESNFNNSQTMVKESYKGDLGCGGNEKGQREVWNKEIMVCGQFNAGSHNVLEQKGWFTSPIWYARVKTVQTSRNV